MSLRLAGLVITLFAMISIACGGARPPSAQGDNGEQKDGAGVAKKTYEELYGALFSENNKEAGQAANELQTRLEEFKPKLLETARKMDPEYSPKAIEMLARFGVEEAREIALQALDSAIPALEIAGIKAESWLKDENAFGKIMEFSRYDDVDTRGNCANVLGHFPATEESKKRLRELAVDDSIRVRMPAYSALGMIADTGAARVLYDALFREAKLKAEGDPLANTAAGFAAAALQVCAGPDDCKWLVKGIGPENPIEVRFTLFEAVAKQHCSDAVDSLIAVTRDPKEDDMTRARAGFFLAYVGDPRGYQAASDIYLAIQNGWLEYDETKFQSYDTLMAQYGGLLDAIAPKPEAKAK